jgi:nucleotide-binding universal stress UspA family protein
MLKRIVLLVDDSPQMDVAAECAVNLAKEHGSLLLLCPLSSKSRAAGDEIEIERHFTQIVQQAQSAGLAYEAVSTAGISFSQSMTAALSADLAVLPYNAPKSAGRTAKRLVRLLTEAGCPVFLPCSIAAQAKTVAVAWDGSGALARALKMHLQLFRRAKLHYLLIHINDDPEDAEWSLEQGTALLQTHGVSADTLALAGDPASRIAGICATVNPHHLVIAPHSERLYGKQRLGYTSRKLLRQRVASLFVYS